MNTVAATAAAGSANGGFGAQPKKPQTYRLTRDIPVEEGYDLFVAGGGPAGAAAAICAARLGAKVLLVEATGCMGGMGTSGMVMGFAPMGDGERCLTCGLARELPEALHARGFLKPGIHPDTWRKNRKWTPFHAEGLKLLYDDLANAAGVEVRFFNRVIDAVADPRAGRVRGAIVQSVEGYRYIAARTFVDGTGNADLAAQCGAPCREAGRDTSGIMPPTLLSLFSGIDWSQVGSNQTAPLKQALADGFFKVPDPHLPALLQIGRNLANANAGHIFDLNALRTKSMTDGMMYGRKLAQEYVAFYRKYVPGCENLEHVITAPVMGVRESRRILGEYELNLKDYLERRQFPDQIGVYNFPIDVHPYDPSGKAFQKFYERYHQEEYKTGECYGIPYGTLVPKGWQNLWVAGRCVSTDVAVNGSLRTQPACSVMGQAAGTAAVQSVRTGRTAAEIDTEILISTLRKTGAYLPQTTVSKRMTRTG